ncbi:hypothetical protein [Pedobacter glucosidilyticus]|nr:hypothetical protein [Pedobacter glucosidilyticus]
MKKLQKNKPLLKKKKRVLTVSNDAGFPTRIDPTVSVSMTVTYITGG